MSATPKPVRVRVRMYQVGFGDSFLVTVEYADPGPDGRAERHILFDLGSTRKPREGTTTIPDIADLIAQHTNGHLDVLVVTHRHKDHLLGFGDPTGSPTLRELAPTLVLRPWTEDPNLPADATAPNTDATAGSQHFLARLTDAQQAVKRIAAQPTSRRGVRRELKAAADDQQPNADAIATLDALAADPRGRYLHAGDTLDLATVVPGMSVTVLGPPTVEQYPEVARQAARDPEYWMMRLQLALDAAVPETPTRPSSGADSHAETPAHLKVPPGPTRWLVEHLLEHRTHSVARLVRALDDALNNTSLILLLEIGGLSMLFPGDAQIENWRYTLDRLGDDPDLRDKLAGIDLYKVGHHGSRNATPRTLHTLWTERPADAPPMTALMSTRSGVHGKTPATAVPRDTLVEALRQVAQLLSTDQLPANQPFVEVVADASRGPFRLVQT